MNPLSLVMDQSVSITAAFSSRPSLHLTGCPDPFNSQWLDLQLTGDWNARYELEQSTDLNDWRELGNITNSFGISDWPLVPTSEEQTRFFRVRNTP